MAAAEICAHHAEGSAARKEATRRSLAAAQHAMRARANAGPAGATDDAAAAWRRRSALEAQRQRTRQETRGTSSAAM
eukprot:259955-Pyramimonas_sp.AAC.1